MQWGVDISLLGVLVTKYGDIAVAKALATAKPADGKNVIVRHLQKQQFVAWQKKGKTIDAVFKYLELHKLEGNVVNSPLLDALQGYIKVYNHATRAEETFLGTLIKGFGGDNKFATMLEKASTIESTNTKAAELRTKLFEYWWDKGVNTWEKLIYGRFKVSETAVGNKVQLKIMADYAKFLATKTGVSTGADANLKYRGTEETATSLQFGMVYHHCDCSFLSKRASMRSSIESATITDEEPERYKDFR
ncbi:hypothetical protein PHMEG_0004106 [Phytophthora megakarya]|uniref:RxLR effector protein n=1 Tax=Phytophthora megakarya TaxID=4795 RepID=A0A225WUP1_9STRA|nr:hypothetical protein PHMEG_0004106 [Phytophthora megakarya]